jgi:predicted nucleic acid-binding protein
MPLTDIPDGVACFLDATILVYHVTGPASLGDQCTELLSRVATGGLSAVTSSAVLAEANHKVMLAEVIKRHSLAPKGLIQRIKKHQDLLDGLSEHKKITGTVAALAIGVEAVTVDLVGRAAEISPRLRLLTNDALTIAVMEKLGIAYLATNDDDFDTVPGIAVFKPARS